MSTPNSLFAITVALRTRLAAMPDNIASYFEGEGQPQFTNPSPFQTVTLIPATPANPTLNSDYYREEGVLRIRLFYPNREGVGAILTQAERIREWFPRGTTVIHDNIKTIVRLTPSISGTSVINDKLSLVVDITYFTSVYVC